MHRHSQACGLAIAEGGRASRRAAASTGVNRLGGSAGVSPSRLATRKPWTGFCALKTAMLILKFVSSRLAPASF